MSADYSPRKGSETMLNAEPSNNGLSSRRSTKPRASAHSISASACLNSSTGLVQEPPLLPCVRGGQTACRRRRCLRRILVALVLVIQALFIASAFFRHRRHESQHHDQERKDSNRSGPVAIIHVGPRKTATTSIQYVLTHNATRELLWNDSFIYLGKKQGDTGIKLEIRDFIVECFGPNHRCQDNATWTGFVDRLAHYRKDNISVILSEEKLARFMLVRNENFYTLRNAFSGFRVRIVVTYRRYFEWIVSEYNQKMKDQKRVKPFVSWYHKQIHGERDRTFMPLTPSLITHWEEFFPDAIEIFNMHEGSDELVERFLCNMIPEAPKVCQASKDGKLPMVRQQQSDIVIDAKIIAQAAARGNFSDENLRRVSATANKYLAGTSSKTNAYEPQVRLPLQCLSVSDMEEILRVSIQIELDLVPDFFYAEKGEIAIKDGFKKAVKENRYCNVDVEEFLTNDRWQNFLHEVG